MNNNGHLTQDDLILFMDRELDVETAAQAEQHLLHCSDCAILLRNLKAGSKVYQQYREQVLDPALAAPATGWARLSQQRIKEKRHRWGLGWAVACACGLVVSFAYWQWQSQPSAQEVLMRAEVAPDRATGSLLLTTGKDRLVRPAVLESGHSEARFQHVRALFVQANYSWENPLSAHSFADWRRRLPQKEDSLTAIRERSGRKFYRLQTRTNAGILKTASLTLQAETYHPTKAEFDFSGEDSIELSEQSEIPKSGLQEVRNIPTPPAKTVETPATPEDELRVFAALDAMGAEAEEPIDVKLDTEHHTVLVTGMGLTSGRRKEIESAVAGIPHTVVRFSTGQRLNDDAINLPNPDVPDESLAFRQSLQDRYGGARQLQIATDKAIDAGNGLFARAHLLLLLAREFPPAVESNLATNSATSLLSLRQRHVGAMGYALRELREDLSPLLAATEGRTGSSRNVAKRLGGFVRGHSKPGSPGEPSLVWEIHGTRGKQHVEAVTGGTFKSRSARSQPIYNRQSMMRALLFLSLVVGTLTAQQGGFISGMVRDRSGDPVATADVRVQNQETAARQTLQTDAAGHYATSELAPGTYKITVRRDGFRTITQDDINIAAGKSVRVDFDLDVLPLQQEVTVSAAQSDIDPTASGLTVSRTSSAATLPANGRDVHALFSIMPGATVTPASISAGGQFTVSGQRPNANSFRVDGMNANIGVGILASPGALPGDSLPGMSTIGGMQSLASKEETETVELRTADLDPEFGDRPGAQLNVSTRAGTNDFHGAVFGYIRPHTLDSQDWFARGAGANLPSAALNGWGGGFGGPIWRNRTFFFASFERTDVHDSALQIIAVPSAAARANPLLAPYLALFDTFPNGTGRALTANESVAYSPLQKVAAVTNRSIRLDQSFGPKWQAFARYSDVPSSSTNSELGTAYSSFRWLSATGGVSRASGDFTQQLRFNFTQAGSNSFHAPQDANAVNKLFDESLSEYFNFWEYAQVSMAGVGRTVFGASGGGAGRQYEAVYVLSRKRGKHDLRIGGENQRFLSSSLAEGHYIYSATGVPSYSYYSPTASIVSPGIDALLTGVPLGLTSSNGAYPSFTRDRFALFGEDSLRVTDRLDILLGLRWDVTFPVNDSFGLEPASFGLGYWRGAASSPVPISSNFAFAQSLWPLRFRQVAPRLGLAYHLKSPNLIVRAGGGLFLDTGLGSVISNTNPLTIWQYSPSTINPAGQPDLYPSRPAAVLSLPQVWEWKASVEKSFWEQSLFSLSYVGARGTKLVRDQVTQDAASGTLEATQFASTGASSYHSLIANLRTNLTPNLYALASYTLGHSIDNGSSDTLPVLIDGPPNKGSSSFDVRQVLSASFGYRTPNRLGHVLGGWTLSSTSFARTGFPFDVTTVDRSIGLGFDNTDRANLVPGQPIWLSGGRTLNPAAFQTPAPGVNGSLGRNALTGFGLFQTDVSVRKQLRLYRGSSVEASISAFNLLNHPSFANPINYLGSALFGQSTSMTNLMLGSGSPSTGLTPLFQAGGPRTVELSLRFSF